MQKAISLSAALFSMMVALASMNANAADGTITINGAVSDTTCSINGTAAGSSANVTATLPTVSASALASAGATAGVSKLGDIQLQLTGCTGSATKAVAHFENGSTVDQSSGNLINQALTQPATNVQVRLLNSQMQPINILTNANNDVAVNGASISAGAGNLNYFAQYYATGQAQPGAVNTMVQYSIQYQ
ncbi:fimbrial protein [Caballeronia sp. LP006]|jgi:major type 1 subunit fimbrin (pilin)|uniref:fimbrial protein n=1 Tax=unclassified Caballeronia TaxID=2646786 RepID=UPI002028B24E|nr:MULTISPECIES: fimbrial protein [unclassified Caballeronia]MDR5775337.1 fimbrial protein [Caballeronia sp. LZ002]MDR5800614.1 fimbrial protein [Caballeronia sp. LZ001]MDR5828875.1 fimbrial protein [Caballeronia sp. LP006]MDR5850775.1 fimbrial protein [Caballeronia sp. LZ003]